MKTQTDLVVVGAGPVGSFTALTAAKTGVDVTMCEEHEEVGVPSHCPGHISIRGLDKLGLKLPESVIENRISGVVFYSPSGNEFRVKLPSPATYVINRCKFDKHMSQLAEKAGARLLLGTKVKGLLLGKNAVCSASLKNGRNLHSKIVVDAEGCVSTLLKQTGLQIFDKSLVANAVNAQVSCISGLDEDTVEVYLGQKYAHGLYAWIIPKLDGSAKIGLATRTGNAREQLKHFLSAHPVARKKLKFADVNNFFYHLIPLGGPIPKTYHNGLLVVGDAASHVKPTTGGGVVMGLTCAKVAGETSAQAIWHNSFSEGFLSHYQERWRQAIGFDMVVMRRIRLMLNHLSDKKLDNIISLCSRLRLSNELQKLQDIDFQGKAVLQLLRKPSAFAVALYSLVSSLTS